MIFKQINFFMAGISLCTASFSSDIGYKSPGLYSGLYGGYGAINSGYRNDGNFAQGRFTLGFNAHQYKNWMLGGELGLQSGNTMRLSASKLVVDPAVDLPPQVVLKPLLDLLFTVKGDISAGSFYNLKGGIAYRQFNLQDRTSRYGDGLSNVAGEFQAGLGFNITQNVIVNVFYQGIYSHSNAGVNLDSEENTTIAYIPTQQAGFLGFDYLFNS